jgi:hypothetical protein
MDMLQGRLNLQGESLAPDWRPVPKLICVPDQRVSAPHFQIVWDVEPASII